MTPRVIPATLAHVREILPKLRPADLAELEATGQPARHVLLQLYRRSTERYVGFLDEEIAVIAGYAGGFVDPVAQAWMFTTPVVERSPIAFMRQTRQILSGWLSTRQEIASACLASYEQSVRFFSLLGFHVGEPYPMGPEGALFRRLTLERANGI